jgi:hypothetical protein
MSKPKMWRNCETVMDMVCDQFYNSRHPNNQTDSLAKVTGPLFFPDGVPCILPVIHHNDESRERAQKAQKHKGFLFLSSLRFFAAILSTGCLVFRFWCFFGAWSLVLGASLP